MSDNATDLVNEVFPSTEMYRMVRHHDGYAYVTDGKMVLRAPEGRLGVVDEVYALRRMNGAEVAARWDAWVEAEAAASVALDPATTAASMRSRMGTVSVPTTKQCPECDGDGEVTCPTCEYDHECASCCGRGRVSCGPNRLVRVHQLAWLDGVGVSLGEPSQTPFGRSDAPTVINRDWERRSSAEARGKLPVDASRLLDLLSLLAAFGETSVRASVCALEERNGPLLRLIGSECSALLMGIDVTGGAA